MTNLKLGEKIRKIVEEMMRKIAGAERRGQKPAEYKVPSPPPATGKIYLKALSLHSLEEVDKIKDEVRSGNILIVKIEPLAEKSIEDVNRAINELSEFIESIGGDIARLGEERIVLTPPNVQIWKEKAPVSHISS